jgi:trehalose 6-phosphate synthase
METPVSAHGYLHDLDGIGRLTTVARAQVVVASNRGPVSFQLSDEGELSMKRGGGGLVSAMSSVTSQTSAMWICAALTDGDREAAIKAPSGRLRETGHDTGGADVRMLALDPVLFDRAYNAIANRTLWFVAHHLYDTANNPVFDAAWRREWAAYVSYNEAFAAAMAEEADEAARVVVQDYHLSLAPAQLRARRPDLRIGHFSHTPWASPAYYALLPDDVARSVLLGILGADHAGFLTERWAGNFVDCCDYILGDDAKVDRSARTVTVDGRTTQVGVHALGIDGAELRERAGRADVASREATLRGVVGDRQMLLRIDRTELSKNIVRGLYSYRELLRSYPQWLGRVVHMVFAYPSRHDLPEYREYTAAVQRTAREINDEFSTEGWAPLHVSVADDFARSLAAYRIADVLVVNPIRDGMNLVAKEGPVLSQRGCSLVLSREAGACAELGDDALVINPYDVTQTARAIHEALSMAPAERAARTRRLAERATALPPAAWFAEQLEALAR